MTGPFTKQCYCAASEEFGSSSATVEADSDGNFLRVVTDQYEGNAQFTLPVARMVVAALQEAIIFAEHQRSPWEVIT